MLLIAVSVRRCGRNLRAKLDTAINSLSVNHAYLKTLYKRLTTVQADSAMQGHADLGYIDTRCLQVLFSSRNGSLFSNFLLSAEHSSNHLALYVCVNQTRLFSLSNAR